MQQAVKSTGHQCMKLFLFLGSQDYFSLIAEAHLKCSHQKHLPSRPALPLLYSARICGNKIRARGSSTAWEPGEHVHSPPRSESGEAGLSGPVPCGALHHRVLKPREWECGEPPGRGRQLRCGSVGTHVALVENVQPSTGHTMAPWELLSGPQDPSGRRPLDSARFWPKDSTWADPRIPRGRFGGRQPPKGEPGYVCPLGCGWACVAPTLKGVPLERKSRKTLPVLLVTDPIQESFLRVLNLLVSSPLSRLGKRGRPYIA